MPFEKGNVWRWKKGEKPRGRAAGEPTVKTRIARTLKKLETDVEESKEFLNTVFTCKSRTGKTITGKPLKIWGRLAMESGDVRYVQAVTEAMMNRAYGRPSERDLDPDEAIINVNVSDVN